MQDQARQARWGLSAVSAHLICLTPPLNSLTHSSSRAHFSPFFFFSYLINKRRDMELKDTLNSFLIYSTLDNDPAPPATNRSLHATLARKRKSLKRVD